MKRLLATGIFTLSVITAGAGLSACGSSTVSDDATASASKAPIAPLKGSGGNFRCGRGLRWRWCRR